MVLDRSARSTATAGAPAEFHRAGAPSRRGTDVVAIEEPLEIRVGGRSVAVVMRTPGHDRELAAGFLLTEGVVRDGTDILDILACRQLSGGESGNVIDVVLAPGVRVDFEKLSRHVFSASSCGICGKATLDAVFTSTAPVSCSRARFSANVLRSLPARLRENQPGFSATGGVHASALFSCRGEIADVREDVGRHNALDKVLGRALLDGRLPLAECGLLVSGRISFELVQKALSAGLPLIVGIGAPSSLAISCAERGNQTLVGFLRRDRLNVYCGAERIVDV